MESFFVAVRASGDMLALEAPTTGRLLTLLFSNEPLASHFLASRGKEGYLIVEVFPEEFPEFSEGCLSAGILFGVMDLDPHSPKIESSNMIDLGSLIP